VDAATCAGRVRGAWDVVKTILPGSLNVDVQPVVDVLDELNGSLINSFAITPPARVTGTGVSSAAPVEVAGGLVLDTGTVVNGRRLRGRLFISPLAQAAQQGVTPPAGTITAINAMGVALIGATPPFATAPCVVWRRPTTSTAGLTRNVISATIAGKWFVLRSRRD